MSIRDRIVELRRVRAADLRRHPHNWRVHPERQRSAMSAVLSEIGYADALIVRRLPDGALELIDGHLRAETTPDTEVPVLVVDLDEREAALLLAVHDPITGLADTDDAVLRELLRRVETEHVEVAELLMSLVGRTAVDSSDVVPPPTEPQLNELFQIVVECRDEAQQREVYERLTAEGLSCRVLTL